MEYLLPLTYSLNSVSRKKNEVQILQDPNCQNKGDSPRLPTSIKYEKNLLPKRQDGSPHTHVSILKPEIYAIISVS